MSKSYFKFFFIFVSLLLLFLIPNDTEQNGVAIYYSNATVDFQLEDETRKRYLTIIKPHGYLDKKPIKKNYFIEYINISNNITAIKKIGSDDYPIWNAIFKNNNLSEFIIYRRDESEVFDPNKILKKVSFNFISQITSVISTYHNQTIKEKFQYNKKDGRLESLFYYVNNVLRKQEIYNYNKDILTKKIYLVFNSENNKLELSYYTKINVSFVENTKKIVINFYNNLDHKFKSITQYFYDDKLIFSEDSLGIRKIFNYDKDKNFSNVLFLNKSNKPIKNTFYYFEKNSDVNNLVNLNSSQKDLQLKYVKNIYYNEFSNKKKEELFEYDPLGSLKQWVIFKSNNSSSDISRSSIIDDQSYQLTYDNNKRLINKKILDNDNFIIGQFNYSYNNKNYIENEFFKNKNKKILSQIKYFYEDRTVDDVPTENISKIFYFSYKSLIKDLILEQSENIIISGKDLERRKKLVEDLLFAYSRNLKKIIFYGKNHQIKSYIRINSNANKDNIINIYIHHYDGDIKWSYLNNPVSSYANNNDVDTTNLKNDQLGYYKEFQEKINDNIKPNVEKLRSSVLFKVKNKQVISFNQINYDQYGKINNKIDYKKDGKLIIKSPQSQDEVIIQEYIEGITNTDI